MRGDFADSDPGQTDVSKLLSRGGRVLAIAALAHIDGQRPGRGPWHALSPENEAAVEEVLHMLNRVGDPSVLETVVRAAMAPEPATSPPKWAKPLWTDPSSISKLGGTIDEKRVALALKPGYRDPSNCEKGLAAMAVALCRSSDGLQALCGRLPEQDGAELRRMACLAQAQVEPEEPTRMRAEIGRLIKEMERGLSDS